MKTNTIFSLGLLGAVLLSVSCSSKFSDYCDKLVSCQGGNDKDRDACVEAARAAEDVASDYDCSDQFDKVIDCTDKITCVNGKLDTKVCDAEEDALDACQDAAKGKKNAPQPQIPAIDAGQ